MTTEKLVPLTKEAATGAAPEAEGEPEQRLEREPKRPDKVILGFGHDATADEIWTSIQEELLKRRGSGEEGSDS